MYKRNRTKQKDIVYDFQIYFNGLSLNNTAKALQRFAHRSHTESIRNWIQKYKLNKRLFYRKQILQN